MKRSKLLDLTAEYLVFSIITGSIGGAFLKAIDIPLSFDQIVLMTLTVFLILRIVFWNKRTAVIAFASAAVVAFIFLYKTEKPLEILNESWQFLRWQISYIGGKTELLPFLIIPTAWLWISAAGIVYFFLLTKLRWFYLPAAIGLTLIIILWFLGHRYIVRYIWFYALGLLLAWGGSRHKNLSKEYDLPSFGRWQIYVLPLAAVIILTTSFILPPDIDYKWMRLVDTVEEIEERINDRYGIFTGPRRSFRLAESGFPSSSNELGGPVQISRDLVLTVKPDPDGEVIRAIGRIYLRGTLLNEYISTGWKNTIGDVRYRFTDRLRNNRKQAAFNFDEEIWSNLHEDKLEAFFYKFEAEVVHTGIKTWTLFHPLQLEEMTVNQRSFVPFYNNKGETFTNRTVEEDEPYTFISRIPNFSNEEFVRYLKEAVPVIDWNEPMPPNLPYNDNYKEKLETVQQYYMNVPDTVPQRVYDLVEELTSDVESPYDKIRAMIDYLGQNFTYTLEPPYTPSDRDFVDYFLFDLKEGYCSYFASALAVMGRIAGIPTCYVEGFLTPARPTSKGVLEVRKLNGHAWVEAYFPGIGWLTFDPTPSGPLSEHAEGETAGENYDEPNEPDYPDEIMEPELPDIDLGLDPFRPNEEETKFTTLQKILIFSGAAIVILFIILAGSLFIWHKLHWEKINRMPLRGQLHRYYSEILWMLDLYGTPIKQGETPYQYAERVDEWLTNPAGSMMDISEILIKHEFADQALTEKDIHQIKEFYQYLKENIRDVTSRPRYLFLLARRILSTER